MWQPLPAELVEISPAAFRDLLAVAKYSTVGGKLLFIMILDYFLWSDREYPKWMEEICLLISS